jgi:uncharacterized damage-inducible protein DinB
MPGPEPCPEDHIFSTFLPMKKTEWLNRKFPAIADNGILPSMIERLSGTPARVEDMISKLSHELIIHNPGGKWSIQEHIGHLSDLEPLWYGRLEELIAGAPELRAADMTNQKTNTANHNATEINVLLQRFRKQRKEFVERLLALKDDQLLSTAMHPRLKTPMRIVDLAYFVAEHDDHHLSSIRENMTA